MKKLFLMIVSAICGVLPFGKANASASTCTYTYSDGTTETLTNCYCGNGAARCIEDYGSAKHEYGYDASGNKIEEIYYSCNNNTCQISGKSNYQYNKSGEYEEVYTRYDSSGNILDFKKWYYGNHADLWFKYDSQGQLIGGYDDVMMSGQCDCPPYSGCGCDFSCDNNGCFYANGDEMGNDRFHAVSNINTPSYFDGDDIYTCPDNAISCHYDEDYGEVVSECEEGYVSDYWGDCQECSNTTSCSYDREKDEWDMECSAGYYQTCTDDYSCCDNECPEGASSCYLEDMDDEDSMVIDSCNNGYLEKDGSCISASAGCGAGYKQIENWCNRIQYTPAEAAPLLHNDNTNSVTITFRK